MLGDREARNIPLAELKPNPHQPRHHMDETACPEELAASSQAQRGATTRVGTAEPRLRSRRAGMRSGAAARAGRAHPAPARSLAETESMKLALLENIQRENLNAMEEAEAIRAIMAALGATHQELAEVLGKSRSTITNMLRPRQSDEPSKAYLELRKSSPWVMREPCSGACRAASLGAFNAAQKGLSVRASARSRAVDSWAASPRTAGAAPDSPQRSRKHGGSGLRGAHAALERNSAAKFHCAGEKGRIEIPFYSNAQLKGILERMGISAQL